MRTDIPYTTNEQLWKMEGIAKAHGYTKTADCYWTQIFTNEAGDEIVACREDTSVAISDPVTRLLGILDPTTEEEENPKEQADPKYTHHSRYFCGHEISPYGLEHGHIDYRTLAKAFDAVLCNDLIARTNALCCYWEPVNGDEYDEEEDTYAEVFQYFIISAAGAEILMDYTDELVWYSEDLDLYVWGVTHWGTAWDYVLTDIPVVLDDEEV